MGASSVQAKAGAEIGHALNLTVPDGLEISGSRLILAVDGRDRVTWTLQPRLN